jgi:hypothetical protein
MAETIQHSSSAPDTSVPGLKSNKLGLDFSSAVGIFAVGTMIYITWAGRRR